MGIRRCGKSFSPFHLFKDYLINDGIKKEQTVEMALDEIDNIKYRNPFELNNYIKSKTAKDKNYYCTKKTFSHDMTNRAFFILV